MNFAVENLIVSGLKLDAALTAIVPSTNIYATQFPNEMESYPYIVVIANIDVEHCEDAGYASGQLAFIIITRQNTNTQVAQIVAALRNLVDSSGFQSANLDVTCRFSRSLPVDTSKLKLQPNPMGTSQNYTVTCKSS